jgi:hypothetical protein
MRRALVVGSETGGLTGVERDATRVAQALRAREFSVELRTGPVATRAGIIGAYRELIQAATADDAVVVYYAGHGALLSNPTFASATAATTPRYLQAIVPTDFDQSTAEDFRGITNVELSALLGELTGRTPNVAVIFDCCHSARMTRGALYPRSLPHPLALGIDAYLRQLQESGISLARPDAESNPHAVRLMAAGVTQSAFEYDNAQGERVGAMTESLLLALEEAGQSPVTWEVLGHRVRERVLQLAAPQRPEVEGPGRRYLFDVREASRTGALPLLDDGRVLGGGTILGVRPGDVYSLVPMTASGPGGSAEIAVGKVVAVRGDRAELALEWRSGHSRVPAGAQAFPVSSTAPKRAVQVEVPGALGERVKAALQAVPLLAPVAAGEGTPLATVRSTKDDRLEIHHEGRRAMEPAAADAAGVESVAENLRQLAAAQSLRELEGSEVRPGGKNALEIEWGRVVDHAAVPLPVGSVLHVGQQVYVRLLNQSRMDLHASIFDIGVGQRISRLTGADPSGVKLTPGKPYYLGQTPDGVLDGLKLSWARGVPQDDVRPETLVIIVTEQPVDLGGLQSGGYRGAERGTLPAGSLALRMEQIQRGGSRDLEAAAETTRPFGVHQLPFSLSPLPAPAEAMESGFVFDERPEPSLRAFAPRGAADPSGKIAIRITDVLIHKNHAWRGALIRLDALVVTRVPGGQEPCVAHTAMFPRINDGDRLPLDNLLVFHGPVQDFVDICVWLSRADEPRPTLTDLLRTETGSPAFQSAATTLLSLTLAGPQAALVVGVTAAVATLASIAERVIRQVAPKSIGLYRTSLLASERFGVGRHPPDGLMRAQECSFGYRIEEVP